MPPAREDFIVQVAEEFDGLEVEPDKIEGLVKAVCKRFGLAAGTVSVAVVNDERFGEVNLRFRDSRSISDCLSFDLSEGGEACFELVVNGELAVQQASLRGHSAEAELALYITHGLLHNLGFDDNTEVGAREMHDAEDEILQQLGYGPVYNTHIKTEPGNRGIDE